MRLLSVGIACAFAASAFAVSAAAPTAAAAPCWKNVIADWSNDNDVDGRYPAACLRQAMVNAPTDLKIYSSLEDDIQAALRARSARRLAGVHASAASLAAPGGSSTLSPLVIVLAGLGLAVAALTGVLLVRRRRAGR
jgi:hypothetical protein